jgi:hypothetical protein
LKGEDVVGGGRKFGGDVWEERRGRARLNLAWFSMRKERRGWVNIGENASRNYLYNVYEVMKVYNSKGRRIYGSIQ